jgi:spore maturation protein CgeB
MRVLIDGPQWAGMWTEITADELSNLGFETRIFYNNKKEKKARIFSKINRLIPATKNLINWEKFQQNSLFVEFIKDNFDLYFSIQGKIDSDFLARIKNNNPQVKTVYWFGDVLVDAAKRRFSSLKEASISGALDLLLVSYQGIYRELIALGFKNVHYFPFGYSKTFHQVGEITEDERKRFTCKVSFVGTHYPERAEIINFLNKHLSEPVQVWGRGWQGSGIKANGRLTLQDSLKVYACSKISLNIHHHLTENGFNMKFYEIPSAGGFQILDWQEELLKTPLYGTPSYSSAKSLLEIIQQFLENENERIELQKSLQNIAFAETDYATNFFNILQK